MIILRSNNSARKSEIGLWGTDKVKKVTITILLVLAITVISIIVYADRNISLYQAIDNPQVFPMKRASVTSIKELSQENSYFYSLNDEELQRLQEILGEQQVSRSYFGNDQHGEFDFSISLDGERISEMIFFDTDGKFGIFSTNRYYTLESEEMTEFITVIFEEQ